jgi:hypothetical protein
MNLYEKFHIHNSGQYEPLSNVDEWSQFYETKNFTERRTLCYFSRNVGAKIDLKNKSWMSISGFPYQERGTSTVHFSGTVWK